MFGCIRKFINKIKKKSKPQAMTGIYGKIKHYLATDFERELFDAACGLLNINGPLRLNSFSCAIRELSRHFLYRLSPNEEVLNAVWFKPYDPEKPKDITRAQRVKYAIQGVFSDEFAKTIDIYDIVKDSAKEIGDAINQLSKYTHVNPETFNNDDETIAEKRDATLDAFLYFFESIDEGKKKVENTILEDSVREEIEEAFNWSINEIDCLATHYEVKYVMVSNIEIGSTTPNSISYHADGSVKVRLQYGSDGDMRRDIGYEMFMEFPFKATCVRELVNGELQYSCDTETIEVDTDEFYGTDIDAEIEKEIEQQTSK